MSVLISFLAAVQGAARARTALHIEVLALRHQLQVLQRSRPRRLRLAKADRWLWAWLSRSWSEWQTALVIVKPETVDRLASPGVPCVLDMEKAAAHRPTKGPDQCPHIDSDDVARQSAMGSPTDSRRAVEIGHGRLSSDRRERQRAPAHIAVAVMAHILGESHPANRRRRFLRRADRHVPTVVCAGDSCARAPPGRTRRGHGPGPRPLRPRNNSAKRFRATNGPTTFLVGTADVIRAPVTDSRDGPLPELVPSCQTRHPVQAVLHIAVQSDSAHTGHVDITAG
jgi:hypothetical protein